MTRFLLVVAVALGTVLTPLGAQSEGVKKCYDCKQTGIVACTGQECKPARCGIKIPHQCDQIYGAPCCHGTQKVICPKCKDPVVAAELQAQYDERQAWVDRMRKFDDACGQKFSHVETDHWIVHWSIPEWKVGDTTLSRVKAAHLFAERLETTSIKMEQILGKAPIDKQVAFLVATEADMMKTTLSMQGAGQSRTFRTMALKGLFTARPTPPDQNTDEGFHAHVVHTGSHSALFATYAYQQNLVSWIDEGLAHYMEMEQFKRPATFCFHEARPGTKDRWEQNDWHKSIYAEVSAKKDPPYATLITRDLDKLPPRDKAYCWSFVDFLVKTKGKEFPAFFERLKSNNDTKKALEGTFHWSTSKFQDEWRAYVLKTYAP